MLSGDNGLLTKAIDSKEKTERAQIIEEAKTDILGKQTEKLGDNLTEKELEEILTKYGTLSKDEEEISDKTLTSTKGNYKIAVKEIYDGQLQLEKAGLYNDDGFIPWSNLIADNILMVDNNDILKANSSTSDFLDGKLVISEEVKSIGNSAFMRCNKLTSVIMPNSVKSIDVVAFMDCTKLDNIKISKNVTTISDSAFMGCSKLTNIVIPENVTSIGMYPFMNCTGLKSVVIGSNDTTGGLKNISDSFFKGLPSLENVILKNSIENIGNEAFSNCTSLKSITIPENVNSIATNAFGNCGLTDLTILGNVTNLQYNTFSSCPLKNVILGSDNINIGLSTIPDGTFGGHSSLETVKLEKSVISIGERAFHLCSSLKSVVISENVTSIGNSAFNNCSNLKQLTIPSTVTNVGELAFNNCSSLTTITVKKGTNTVNIGRWAFVDSGLTDVYYTGTATDWNSLIEIADNNATLNEANMHWEQEAP